MDNWIKWDITANYGNIYNGDINLLNNELKLSRKDRQVFQDVMDQKGDVSPMISRFPVDNGDISDNNGLYSWNIDLYIYIYTCT